MAKANRPSFLTTAARVALPLVGGGAMFLGLGGRASLIESNPSCFPDSPSAVVPENCDEVLADKSVEERKALGGALILTGSAMYEAGRSIKRNGVKGTVGRFGTYAGLNDDYLPDPTTDAPASELRPRDTGRGGLHR